MHSQNTLIVVKELQGKKYDNGEVPETQNEIEKCNARLRIVMGHELLHALIPEDGYFPHEVYEGITEFFARIISHNYKEGMGYPLESDIVLLTAELCAQSGLDRSAVKVALLGHNTEQIVKMKKIVEATAGKEVAKRFFEKGFQDPTEMKEYLNILRESLKKAELKSEETMRI